MKIKYLNHFLLLLGLSKTWCGEEATFVVPKLESLITPFNEPNSRMITDSDIIGHTYYNQSKLEYERNIPKMRGAQYTSFHS